MPDSETYKKRKINTYLKQLNEKKTKVVYQSNKRSTQQEL